MKKIGILLPGPGPLPGGGMKVLYEYANRLSKDGYQVKIIYPISLFFKKMDIKKQLRTVVKFIFYKFIKEYSSKKWFNLDTNIETYLTLSLNQSHIPAADIYIASSVETAMYLKDYNISNNNKLYFIQDFENWNVADETVKQTYKYGFKNIVISNWLAEILKNLSVNYHIIKNGFDFDYFKLSKRISERNRYSICVLYNPNQRKGFKYTLQTLSLVKKEFPQLEVNVFGIFDRPSELPSYMKYFKNPSRSEHNYIYNNSAIFLSTSLEEGWGLPVGEAMICGCSVVCTDNKGFREMAEDGVTALLSQPKDIISFSNNIIKLIKNDELRIHLAENGLKNIKKFTWDKSYKELLELIK